MGLRIWMAIIFALFIILSVGTPSHVQAQVFELNAPEYYPFEPVFTNEYIAKNKIKTIRAAIVYKRDNEAIDDKGLSKCWEYDSVGLLKRFYFTTVRGYVNKEIQHPAIYRRGRRIAGPHITLVPVFSYDTTFTNYFYNSKKQILIRRTRDGDYYNSVYYEYDEQGNIRKQSVFKETNASENKYEFRIGVQNLLSVEEFRYEKLSPSQIKRKHLNDEGKVYKETIMNFDASGKLTEENNSFIVSWMRSSTKLQYDSIGRVSRKIYTSNENGDELNKSEFKYIDGNFVDVERRFKGDVLYYELNFIYDRQNKQLLSHFVREFLNKGIVILRYSYEVY